MNKVGGQTVQNANSTSTSPLVCVIQLSSTIISSDGPQPALLLTPGHFLTSSTPVQPSEWHMATDSLTVFSTLGVVRAAPAETPTWEVFRYQPGPRFEGRSFLFSLFPSAFAYSYALYTPTLQRCRTKASPVQN